MNRKQRNKQQAESAMQNNLVYINYVNRLTELALNVFKWENLPPTVDERFLELSLFEKGYALYFNDEDIGNLALTCTIGGKLDVYRIPMLRTAYANNGYNKPCTNKDSVLIFNNYLHTPTTSIVKQYALLLYEIDRAISVNVKAQKTPVMIKASETQKLSMINAYMQYEGNMPFIFGDDEFNMEGITTLTTNAPFTAPELQVLKNAIWNEFLTFCGIENSNQDKKERMVSDEVGSNYGNVEAQRNIMLNSRQQACKQINAMFNTNITVRFRSDLQTTVNVENVSRETLNGGDEN